jgi:predicted HTH transcriptional regulator
VNHEKHLCHWPYYGCAKTLDYKSSGALAKDSKSRDELCKDVSAFANSAGGQIVYGIDEKNKKLDGGSALTREWIEQVPRSLRPVGRTAMPK